MNAESDWNGGRVDLYLILGSFHLVLNISVMDPS